MYTQCKWETVNSVRVSMALKYRMKTNYPKRQIKIIITEGIFLLRRWRETGYTDLLALCGEIPELLRMETVEDEVWGGEGPQQVK